MSEHSGDEVTNKLFTDSVFNDRRAARGMKSILLVAEEVAFVEMINKYLLITISKNLLMALMRLTQVILE